jgi:hypothetical protein
MSAQLIIIPFTKKEEDGAPEGTQGDEKSGPSSRTGGAGGSSAEPSGNSGQSAGASPDIPPWRPLPVGTVKVFGQAPNEVGQFDSIPALFHSLHGAGLSTKLPGGSNTVFATVKDLGELENSSLRDELAKLPPELTIVISPINRDERK